MTPEQTGIFNRALKTMHMERSSFQTWHEDQLIKEFYAALLINADVVEKKL